MDRLGRRNPWGWPASSRVLVATLTLLVAAGLGLRAPGGDRGPAVDAGLVVDPNTAPPEVLLALPRLGPALVGRIVEARGRGPFRSVEDLDVRVRGIGPATAAALRPYLRFGPGGPADAETTVPRRP